MIYHCCFFFYFSISIASFDFDCCFDTKQFSTPDVIVKKHKTSTVFLFRGSYGAAETRVEVWENARDC